MSVSKSDCSCNVSKPVICNSSNQFVCKIINNRQVFNPVCESVVVNHSKRDNKRSFNVSSQKHGFTKSLNVRHILMTSTYFHELVLLLFIFHHNFCNGNVGNFFKGYVTRNNFSRNNFLSYDSFIYHDVHSVNIFNISHTKVLSSSDRFYPLSFYLSEYSFFIYSVFNGIFYVNNITNIFDDNLYITCLLNRDNKFLYCNCMVTVESITLFQQGNKFKVHKIFITSINNSVFLIIIFIGFRFLAESKRMPKVMLFGTFLVFDSFFKISNQRWFSFQFFTLTKMSEK